MSKAYLLTKCMIGLAVFVPALPCQAQGNIDRGRLLRKFRRNPCTSLPSRSGARFKRTSAAFLREHYSVSSAEASAMAAYLAGFHAEPAQQSALPRPPI
jgi:hypothetical protein